MKEPIEIKMGEKTYELMYTVRSLEKFETYLGTSLFAVMAGTLAGNVLNLVQGATIHFIVSGLKAGILNQPKDFDVYDFVDEYCDQGGNLGELAGYITQAIEISGLFTVGTSRK